MYHLDNGLIGQLHSMLLYSLAILAGIVLLLYGADRFVVGAAAAARNLGVSPLLIGLTIVGFATSAPEILVSVTAALRGATDMAVGNAIGSNIANIGMVLGIGAMIRPIMISGSGTLRREFPMLIGITLLVFLLFLDDRLSIYDGFLLLTGLAIFLYWIIRIGFTSESGDSMAAEYDAEIPRDLSTKQAFFWLFAGFAVLLVGSNLLVWGAEEVARTFGVSELVIGLTILAIGTSLPELAVTAMSAFKGEAGLALGNIVGSNIYNLLAVVGVAATIHPADLSADVVRLHYPVMAGFTVALYLMAYNYKGNDVACIKRYQGVILFVAFLAYHVNNI